MRALRKGQAAAFNITRDIHGEARMVERAFGLGPSALAEAVQFVGKRLNLEAARRSRLLSQRFRVPRRADCKRAIKRRCASQRRQSPPTRFHSRGRSKRNLLPSVRAKVTISVWNLPVFRVRAGRE
jgi:hypothetical protein